MEQNDNPGALRRLPGWWPLALLMLIGLLIRLYVAIWTPILYADTTEYFSLAKEIRSGTFFSPHYRLEEGFGMARQRPPLYSIFISPAAASENRLMGLAVMVSILAGLGGMIPLYFAAEKIFSPRAAIMAAAFLSFQPFIVEHNVAPLSDSLFALWFSFLCWCATRLAHKPGKWVSALAGVICGLALATRDAGIGAGPMLLGIIGVNALVLKQDRRTFVRQAIFFLAAYLIVLSPYLAHIRIRTGTWSVSPRMTSEQIGRKLTQYGESRADRDYVDRTREFFADTAPSSLAPNLVAKTSRNLISYSAAMLEKLSFLLIALIIIGVAAWPWLGPLKKEPSGWLSWVWLMVFPAHLWFLYALVSPYMVDERYMYPVLTTLLLFGGGGAEAIGRAVYWAGRKAGLVARKARLVERGALAALLTAAAALAYPSYMNLRARVFPQNLFSYFASGHLEAARDLQELGLVRPGATIASRKPFIAYYLDGKPYRDQDTDSPFPKTMQEVEELIKVGTADYLVADSYTLRNLRPAVLKLAFAFHDIPGATVVYSRYFDEYQRIITIYDLKHSPPAPDSSLSAERLLARAQTSASRGHFVQAYRDLERALEQQPENRGAWALKLKILDYYYQSAKRSDDLPTMLMVPDLMVNMVEAAANYAHLDPGDQEARELFHRIKSVYDNEKRSIPQNP